MAPDNHVSRIGLGGGAREEPPRIGELGMLGTETLHEGVGGLSHANEPRTDRTNYLSGILRTSKPAQPVTALATPTG